MTNPSRSEIVSLGTERIGRINQTPRGFELFDAEDRYLHTEVTIQAARRTLYERHRDEQQERTSA